MQIDSGSLCVRCDGTTKTGLGHVSRCLGLAEALREIGQACFFFGDYGEAAIHLLADARMPYIHKELVAGSTYDVEHTAHLLKSADARGLILDSYAFNDASLMGCASTGYPIILIDDFMSRSTYPCAVILNFTAGASALCYPPGNYCMLLGPRYLLLRRALHDRRQIRLSSKVSRVLVSIGGTDRHNLTKLAIELLQEVVPDVAVDVVVGQNYGGTEHLVSMAKTFAEFRLFYTLPSMAQLFAQAELCISGGGLTKYESAYMGVPTLILSQTEEQAHDTIHFAEHGLGIDLRLFQTGHNKMAMLSSLSEIVNNYDQRCALIQHTTDFFGSDPTLAAAQAVLAAI
jgi:UDP-2,4-diacetamido-2,4,6-trideoxy-beta-L-altropyranose hydrolase